MNKVEAIKKAMEKNESFKNYVETCVKNFGYNLVMIEKIDDTYNLAKMYLDME